MTDEDPQQSKPRPQKTPKEAPERPRWFHSRAAYGAVVAIVAAATAGITALLMNIAERKAEQQQLPSTRMVDVDEDTTDPEKWGVNWPAQYDAYLRTALPTKTCFGGHAGSEALPEQKIERHPWLKRMFLGDA